MAGNKGLSWGSITGMDVQDHVAFGQELPVSAGFEEDFNPHVDFDAIRGSLTPSEFLTCMPKDLSNPASGLDATALFHNTQEHSAGTGNNLRSVFPLVSKCLLSSMTSQGTSRSIESHSEQTTTCTISALNILQALHIPPTLQLLLTIICGKLITWYRATLRNDLNSGDSPFTVRSIANSSTDDDEHVERVLRQPITVGDYSLDPTLESKIRAQIVCSELQRLESVVENLSRRFQEAKVGNLRSASGVRDGSISAAGSGLLTPENAGLAKVIHRNLSTLLHNQLQAVKAETAFILSNEHD
ncbi:MAG: hypothetical protein LQ347_002185 [Umbilicaria vellea]|nr:MAG: hypothetical protein LQ347_002185 [Umbilicaria vellea]